MKKQKNNVLLLIASILSFLMAGISVLLFLILAFDLFGVQVFYSKLLSKYVGVGVNVSEQVTMACIEFIIAALMNAYFGRFYLKGFKHKINSKQYGKVLISEGVFQMILAAFLPGLLALIAGIIMVKSKPRETQVQAEQKPELMSNYKFEAMAEAVTRLKELKEKGAISEEEYYATLNKILES